MTLKLKDGKTYLNRQGDKVRVMLNEHPMVLDGSIFPFGYVAVSHGGRLSLYITVTENGRFWSEKMNKDSHLDLIYEVVVEDDEISQMVQDDSDFLKSVANNHFENYNYQRLFEIADRIRTGFYKW